MAAWGRSCGEESVPYETGGTQQLLCSPCRCPLGFQCPPSPRVGGKLLLPCSRCWLGLSMCGPISGWWPGEPGTVAGGSGPGRQVPPGWDLFQAPRHFLCCFQGRAGGCCLPSQSSCRFGGRAGPPVEMSLEFSGGTQTTAVLFPGCLPCPPEEALPP